jgi:membrane protein
MIYKFMPRVAVQWHDVWWGAATTACLFTFGHFLISFYIGKSGIASGFGAAGSVAVIFVWVYYSAQIFLLGAEFTWVYANRFGSMRSHATDQSSPAPDPIDAVSEEVPSDRGSVATPPQREPTAIIQLVTTVGVAIFAQVVWPWLVDRLAARRLGIPHNSQGRLRTRR